MPSFNSLILVGHLGKDTELKFLPSGTPVAENSVAVTEHYTDKDGNKKESTMWVDIQIWGKSAEIFTKYTKKGDPVLLNGKLSYRQWEAQDGSKRSKHEMKVLTFQFLKGKSDAQGGDAPEAEDDCPF